MPYGSLSGEEFSKNYGVQVESRLRSISNTDLKVEKIETEYGRGNAHFAVRFGWGVPIKAALKETETAVVSVTAQMPQEMRDGTNVGTWNQNAGFLAISFYSSTRSLDDLYEYLNPLFAPRLARISDADHPNLWNPSRKEVLVEVRPEALASLQIRLRDVTQGIQAALSSSNGGSLSVNTDRINVIMPRTAMTLDDLSRVPIYNSKGVTHALGDIAQINLVPTSQSAEMFKTSGAPSLILFSAPAPGGNIKRMAEEIMAIVREVEPTLPKDIHFKVLVDPSEFIRSAVNNVLHEVVMAAILAVMILFLFVGSIRNVATAAIEIPLSIVLAFILMKMNGIYLNIISLGGLALSAGMNVDASVVVMENIFRHFEPLKSKPSFTERLNIIVEAVNEVKLPVIASTVASIVVFLPLAMTSDLSYAILGDLAKTVVFSHAFSAVVALILVPTIRLQLMTSESSIHHHSPIEGFLSKLENWYANGLAVFIRRTKLQIAAYLGVAALLAVLVLVVLPRLPKEIVGTPDTDWLILLVNTQGNTFVRQMDAQTGEIENRMMDKFADRISYTFTQIHGPNSGNIMARLKDKSDMNKMWKDLQGEFVNTPFLSFFVVPWNPSELPIPDPPDLRISVLGGTAKQRVETAREVREQIEDKHVFSRLEQQPSANTAKTLTIRPHLEQWTALNKNGADLAPSDLADLSRVASDGRWVGQWVENDKRYDIIARFPEGTAKTAEDIASLPLGINDKLIPLKALADVTMEPGEPASYRENGQDIAVVTGGMDLSEKSKTSAAVAVAEKVVLDWQKEHAGKSPTSIQWEDSKYELTGALNQLGWAIGLSVVLIFVTMVIQLGDVVSSLLVLISVPLGFIGVLISLFIFHSTLSLNSALGVILLNGLAVANSIILVDFLNRLVQGGMAPEEAAIKAAKTRLRPILMTSLATAMGMLPIALGMGEGGRILQPLGITVSCGLWFSMMLTLFLVPALQVRYMRWRLNHHAAKVARGEADGPGTAVAEPV